MAMMTAAATTTTTTVTTTTTTMHESTNFTGTDHGSLQERPSSEAELKKKKNPGPVVVAAMTPYLVTDGKNGASLEF